MPIPTFQSQGQWGDAVLLLHGIGGNAASWTPQLSFFGKYFQAVAWNMPGYGGSPLLAEMTFATLADALEKLLDTLKIPQVHLIGHSMGGMVAQEFMIQRQHRVKSLVLYATSPSFGKPEGPWQKDFVRRRLQPLEQGNTMNDLSEQLVQNLLGDHPEPTGVQLAKNSLSECSPKTYRKALECLVKFECRENLPHIQVPTLVVAGEKDTAAPAFVMKKMAHQIHNSQYHCVSHAGHLIHLEQPNVFNEIVLAFLSRHASSH